MKEGFVVIGLGTLGWQAAAGLHRAGASVLAIDLDQELVDGIQHQVTKAVALDATDLEALRSVGVFDLDNAIISLPHHFDAAVLIVFELSRHGFENIIARVETVNQAEALRAIGATATVFPERDSAQKLVRGLLYPSLADEIPLGEEFAALELPCPPQWDGQALSELNLRRKFKVNLIAVKQPASADSKERVRVTDDPDDPLDADWNIVVLGIHRHLAKFKEHVDKLLADAREQRQEESENGG